MTHTKADMTLLATALTRFREKTELKEGIGMTHTKVKVSVYSCVSDMLDMFCLEDLPRVIVTLQEKYGPKAFLTISDGELYVLYKRDETDIELNQRLSKALSKEGAERRLYESLKKKFEST